MKNYFVKRKKNRLKNYDYTRTGMYFITICTKNRIEILGKIIQNNITLTKAGIISKECLQKLEQIYDNIKIDDFIIMPNHIHIIIEIKKVKKHISISKIIKTYKSHISHKLRCSIWQKSYHDHIIRNEKEFYAIKQYIHNNILNWKKDKYF